MQQKIKITPVFFPTMTFMNQVEYWLDESRATGTICVNIRFILTPDVCMYLMRRLEIFSGIRM